MSNREMVEKAIEVCKKNQKLFNDIGISEFGRAYDEVKKALYVIKLQEDYGILHNITRGDVKSTEPVVYVRIDEHMCIASMGKKYNRTISWSVDGRQPQDEVMLAIKFPTGAYIFGDSYPVDLFKEMWEELKTYDFKYVDDVNHCIYFPLDKAAPIANAFPEILKKYYKKFRDEANIRRAAELRRELERLEGNPAEQEADNG